MTIKNDYILMRVTASRRDGGMARLDIGRRGQPSGAALQDLGTRIEHISIVEQTLDAKQHREAAEAADARLAAGEGTVDLILPQLPLHLIRPQAEAPADAAAIAAAAPGNTAWGLPATGAWPRKPGVTGAGVRVAVLDTGIDTAHPAFAGVSISGENFVGGPVADISDGQGHGTHCAGTIFGRAVDGIEIGIAPGVTDVLIGKVFDNNGSSRSGAILKALDWAGRRGAQVISMSLGFSFDGYVAEKLGQGYPQAIAVAIAIDAFQRNLNAFSLAIASVGGAGGADVYGTPRRGAVVVVAAGNASQRQINPAFVCPASLPANTSDDVVAVAALGQPAPGSYRIADFSNGEARLSAPGVDVLSARAGGGLALMSGTSMACPHVAGLAALWWQFAAPGTRASMIRSLLEGNARPNQILAYTLPDHGLGLARAP